MKMLYLLNKVFLEFNKYVEHHTIFCHYHFLGTLA